MTPTTESETAPPSMTSALSFDSAFIDSVISERGTDEIAAGVRTSYRRLTGRRRMPLRVAKKIMVLYVRDSDAAFKRYRRDQIYTAYKALTRLYNREMWAKWHALSDDEKEAQRRSTMLRLLTGGLFSMSRVLSVYNHFKKKKSA